MVELPRGVLAPAVAVRFARAVQVAAASAPAGRQQPGTTRWPEESVYLTLMDRTVDQAPGLPPASFARARQNRSAIGSEEVANCESVTT